MTNRELLEQWLRPGAVVPVTMDATRILVEALRARLAQPEQEIESDQDHVEDDGCPTEKAVLQRFWREHQKQEPAACPYCHYSHTLGAVYFDQNCAGCVKRMTTPPQREWQTMTENEIKHLWYEACQTNLELTSQLIVHLARNIEAKLKEKNEKL